MAGFRTHITTSTILGIGYGATGYSLGMPWETSLLATGLCSVSGMLPDLDSDSGIPVREMFSFSAAVIPLLMIDRFEHLHMSQELMVLVGGLIYLFVRFVVARWFKQYTVHRGMWHSIPAAFVALLLAFLICSCEDIYLRAFKSFAVFLGFVSHLVLDEIYSFEIRQGKLRIKNSFGTALKFWSKKGLWPNVSTYGKLLILLGIAVGDPWLMQHWEEPSLDVPHTANQWLNDLLEERDRLFR